MLRDFHRVLNACAFWLVAHLAVLVGSTAFGFKCTHTKSRAYVTAMKSDLRNFSALQNEFRSRHGRYATASELYPGFLQSTGVRVVFSSGDANSWTAHASHVRLARTSCVMSAGDEMPICQGQEKAPPRSIPTGNRQLDFALDLAGVAIVLARRQRRLARPDY